MPVKYSLLLTVLLMGTATTAYAQDAPPLVAFQPQPAPPVADALVTAPPRASGGSQIPSYADRAVASGAVRTATPQSWDSILPKPPITTAEPDLTAVTNQVDISALRYFASQNDMVRVAAEIRLLRSKNSNWEPPEDLFSAEPSGETEKPLWELFAKHDLQGLRTTIASMRQDKADWQPTSNLLGQLAMAEAHDALVTASEARQWGMVIDIASANKMLMTCADLDALWRTAEALIQTGDEPHALEAYRYILASCAKPEDRLSTVQKASLLLKSPEGLDSLLQMGKRLPDGSLEFEQVRLDLMRRKIGDAAAGKSGPVPDQAEIDAITTHARNANDRNDAQMLGWYDYSRKDFVEAENWFRTVLQSGPDPKAAEGLVLTLRAAGKLPEARKLAQQYASLDHMNRKLMVEVLCAGLDDPSLTPLSPEDLASLAKTIDAETSADGAQAYGWHLYKAKNFAAAGNWFKKSAAWQSNESAVIGLMVTAKQLKHDKDYAGLVSQYRGAYPKIADLDTMIRGGAALGSVRTASGTAGSRLRGGDGSRKQIAGTGDRGWDKSADEIVKTFEGGNYDQAVAMLEQRRRNRGAEPQGLSVVRGWAMYHKGDWEGAKQVFSSLDGTTHTRESEEGLRVIQMGYTGQRYR